MFAKEMNISKQHSRFSWNFVGLLGSALGFSTWMVLTAFVADWHLLGVVIAFACVTLILIPALILWRMRGKIEAFRGIIFLLAIAFISNGIFLASAHSMGLTMLTSWPSPRFASAAEWVWQLLLFPALGVLFWIINKSNLKANKPVPHL
ncbi:MAG: hypothetical protein QM627_02700 [Luteolibacter sp.]